MTMLIQISRIDIIIRKLNSAFKQCIQTVHSSSAFIHRIITFYTLIVLGFGLKEAWHYRVKQQDE